MATTDPRFAPFDMEISPELYDEIRERWLEHVSNEEKLLGPVSQQEWDRYLGIDGTAISTSSSARSWMTAS